MESSEEKYSERIQQIQNQLNQPKMKKKVEEMLKELSRELNCHTEFNFNVYPEADDYQEHMASDEFVIPRGVVHMKLGDFIDHISKEDRDYNLYIDPLYMNKGVNEINDVLTTTVNNAVIIIPITTKK